MLSDFPARSVVMLGDGARDLLQGFRDFAGKHFPDAATHVLVRDLSLPLRLLMVVAHRRRAPHDLLLRLDLAGELTEAQRTALAGYRAETGLLVFQTTNHQFHNEDTGPDDVVMAFINTWPAHLDRAEARRHWLDDHGPLVREVGLPPVVTSYTQVHFDDSFDDTYQGLSFETITSQRDLVRYFVRHASIRRLNRILLEDERNFTGPPLFFAFRTVWTS